MRRGARVGLGCGPIRPRCASHVARAGRQCALAGSGLGCLGALLGVSVAYRWDLPVGPTDVALLGLIYALVFLLQKAAQLFGAGPAGSRLLPSR